MKQHIKSLVTITSRDGSVRQIPVDTTNARGTDEAFFFAVKAIRDGGTVLAEPVRGTNINSKAFLFQNGTSYRSVVSRNETKARELAKLGGSWVLLASGNVDASKPWLPFEA